MVQIISMRFCPSRSRSRLMQKTINDFNEVKQIGHIYMILQHFPA
jgi:hypothetical protein